MTVTRRTFIKGSAVTAAVTMASGTMVNTLAKPQTEMTPGPGNKWPGKVAINFNKSVITSSGSGMPEVDSTVVKKMVDDTIMLLTDETTVGAAWKAVFPATLTATSTIGIKIPIAFATQRMAPHWSVVKAIVDGLVQMDINGASIPPANITVWEMEGTNNMNSFGYTSTNIPGVNLVYHAKNTRVSGSVDGATTSDGKKKYDYAKSMQADFLINVFRPGGHFPSGFEGFTLAFKNHYGTYYPQDFHAAAVAPKYLRDINCTGVVFNKSVLMVCSGLFGAKEASGSPGSSDINYSTYVKTMDSTATVINPSTIIMTTDPVSAEMQAIKMMRLNNGKNYDTSSLPVYLKASAGVEGALSDKVYNIGVIDEAKMDIRKIINNEKATVGINNRNSLTLGNRTDLRVKTLRNHASTFIEYSVPHSCIGMEASIRIVDLKGNNVFSTKRSVNGVVNNYSWNEQSNSGQRVSNGTYVISVTTGTARLSQQITLHR